MNRQLVAELEQVLRSNSGTALFATAGTVNYRAQAEGVAGYLSVVLCADCRDDMSDTTAEFVSLLRQVGN